MGKVRHPVQPLEYKNGAVCFKENSMVRFLLDWASSRGMSLNELAVVPICREDRQHFAQLIGYSVDGYNELSYHDRKIGDTAFAEAEKMRARRKRNGRRG